MEQHERWDDAVPIDAVKHKSQRETGQTTWDLKHATEHKSRKLRSIRSDAETHTVLRLAPSEPHVWPAIITICRIYELSSYLIYRLSFCSSCFSCVAFFLLLVVSCPRCNRLHVVCVYLVFAIRFVFVSTSVLPSRCSLPCKTVFSFLACCANLHYLLCVLHVPCVSCLVVVFFCVSAFLRCLRFLFLFFVCFVRSSLCLCLFVSDLCFCIFRLVLRVSAKLCVFIWVFCSCFFWFLSFSAVLPPM